MADIFHSPILAQMEVSARLESMRTKTQAFADIRFNEREQFKLLETFAYATGATVCFCRSRSARSRSRASRRAIQRLILTETTWEQ